MSKNIIRSDLIYLLAIIQAVKKIQIFTKNINYVSDFKNDDMVIVNACLQQFAYMGENVGKINPLTRDRYPNIPWSQIKSFRNNIVHEYQKLNLEIVFTIIKERLPVMEPDLYSMLQNELLIGNIPWDHYEVAKDSDFYAYIDFNRIKKP